MFSEGFFQVVIFSFLTTRTFQYFAERNASIFRLHELVSEAILKQRVVCRKFRPNLASHSYYFPEKYLFVLRASEISFQV